jgi:hypothetical protein
VSGRLHPIIADTASGPRIAFVPESVTAAAGDRFTIDGKVYEVRRQRVVGPAQRTGMVQRPKPSTATKPAQVQRPKASTSTKPTMVRRPTVTTARCRLCERQKARGWDIEVGTVTFRGDAPQSSPCSTCGHRSPRSSASIFT